MRLTIPACIRSGFDAARKPDSGEQPVAARPGRRVWLRRFIRGTVVAGGLAMAGSVASDTVRDALKAAVAAAVPDLSGPACGAREWWATHVARRPAPDPTRFLVLVTALPGDDGSLSRKVADAFTGQRGFARLRTCRGIDLDGEDRLAAELAAEKSAEALRAGRGADLVIWGQVADAGAGAVRLWFSAAAVKPNLARQPWKIEAGLLAPKFHAEFANALQTEALAAVPSLDEARGQAVTGLLRARLPQLRALAETPPEALQGEAGAPLRFALAVASQIYGEQAGDNAALREAVARWSGIVAATRRDHGPLDWAVTQNNLGTALATLGARGEDAALRRAVAAYEAALEELTRNRVPLDWEMTQNNLGAALSTLGERGDDAALRRAVAAYEAALEERTRERVPLDWAMTQNNLGNAQATLGERSDDAALRRAVTAYEAALEEHTRQRVPLDWAMTQNNLGTALMALGERGEDAALHRAVAAYEAALEVRTRERVPLAWATTQNNLGNALARLGAQDDNSTLRRAVVAYEAALEEYTRDRAPYPWAVTTENRARVEESLAERLGEPARLRRALALAEGALQEFARFGATYNVEKATRFCDRLRARLAAP